MKNKDKIITTVILTKENREFAKEKAKNDNRSFSSYLNNLITQDKNK